MNKKLETLEKLLSFAFVMSENMVGLTKGNYDENQFIKKTYEYLHKYNVDVKSQLELKAAIKRLEAIDNANPSEALKCIENIEADLTGLPKHTAEYDDGFDNYIDDIWDNIDTVKQSLIKEQKEHKALEIIKEEFELELFKLDNGRVCACAYTDNNNDDGYSVKIMSEEKFDLLEEVLEWIKNI